MTTLHAHPVADAAGESPVPTRRRFLMCEPTYFDVTYRINPWMDPAAGVDQARALAQWRALRDHLTGLGHEVCEMAPAPGLPDLVFAANGGIVIGDRGLVPRFRHRQRAPESEHFAAAMRDLGLRTVMQAQFVNEGEGDFLLVGEVMLGGNGLRSDPRAVHEVGEFFDVPVVPLTLVDPRFYHLDTALARLDADTIAYWPGAFDEAGRGILRDLFPEAVEADEGETAVLGLNLVSDGHRVLMSPQAPRLAAQLSERGFTVAAVPTDELRKSGGGAKCCVLELHATPTWGA